MISDCIQNINLLQVTVEGGVESVQGMKKKVREALGGEGVAYVDTRVGAPEAWIRFNQERL